MKIEITPEQFNQIQDEIIKLEEKLENIFDDTWLILYTQHKISKLKNILETEKIDLDKTI